MRRKSSSANYSPKIGTFHGTLRIITFDLIFQSSLPSATSILARNLPHLKKLILKCDIYDIDDNKSMIIPDANYPPPEDGAKRPVLDELSVPGYSFSQISQLGQKWLSEIGGQNKWFTLSVDRFTLQKNLMPPYDAPDRTFEGFMDTIENMACTVLYLSNLTFGYRPKPGNKEYTFQGEHLIFDDVSPEFISTFLQSVTVDNLNVLSFKRCLIPSISPPLFDGTFHSHLLLEDIPFRPPAAILPPPWSANHFPDSSLYNAINLFACSHLFLTKCEGVGDDFFEWLSGEEIDIPAQDLKAIKLESCTSFTSGGLRDLIETRESLGRSLVAVEVSGKGPMLSKQDLAWFLDESESSTHVNWNVEADASMGQDFVADLRPVGEDKRHEHAMYLPLFD